ncbi:hypothetical protein BGZ91_007773 [Linnemannia elongata]|nr:hypothetical protein BGZ91_007773 [Linnemannia elongata]
MDLLISESSTTQAAEEAGESPYSTDGESEASPCVARQRRRDVKTGDSVDKDKRGQEPDAISMLSPKLTNEEVQIDVTDPTLSLEHFATLGQATDWSVEGIDMVQKFRDFRPRNLGPFSLARDGIADLTHESTFSQVLDPTLLSVARRADPAPDVYERWPTLRPICDRVFVSNNYDEVARAVRSENMHDPIAAYLFVVIMAYWQYFQFHEEVPENINEREGFSGLTWSFLQTPLTMYGIQSRYLEVLITAVEGRKNQDKDPLLEVKEIGQYADAVAIHNNQQLLLAEASLVHSPKQDKRQQDKFKLAMRD